MSVCLADVHFTICWFVCLSCWCIFKVCWFVCLYCWCTFYSLLVCFSVSLMYILLICLFVLLFNCKFCSLLFCLSVLLMYILQFAGIFVCLADVHFIFAGFFVCLMYVFKICLSAFPMYALRAAMAQKTTLFSHLVNKNI